MCQRLRFSLCEPHPEGTKRLHDVRISRLTVSCRVLPRVSNYKNCSWLMDLPMAPRKIARRFASPVRHSFQLHHGLGAARNHGMRMARGRFICVVYFIGCHTQSAPFRRVWNESRPLQPFRTSPTSRIIRSDEGRLPDFNGPLDIHNSGPKRCQTRWPIDELRWARRPTCRSFSEGTRSSDS